MLHQELFIEWMKSSDCAIFISEMIKMKSAKRWLSIPIAAWD